MAKFAKIGYGSEGQGLGTTTDGYTYVVNDNVKTKQKLQVISTQASSRKKFVTTGLTLHVLKENSALGQEAKQQSMQATGKEPTDAFTSKELGAKGSKREFAQIGEQKPISKYTLSARAKAIEAYKQKDPNAEFSKNANETFDTYSKKYIKEE